MAKATADQRVIRRTMQQRRLAPTTPAIKGVGTSRRENALPFLDFEHPIYQEWKDRWEMNEERLLGGDAVIDELRPFNWEVERGEDSAYAKRQAEAIYTNFPDIFLTAITSHLLRFAPKPDAGFAIPSLGKIVGRSRTPSRAEQIWFSVDNPSGAGSEWNTWWLDAEKRAAATGHRWVYVDTPGVAPRRRDEEFRLGLRPYVVEFSPLDVPNWYINPQGIIEFVVIRVPDLDPSVENGSYNVKTPEETGYLLLVREGVTRLGPQFIEGGWWTFNSEKFNIDHDTWDDTLGEIPISPLFYNKHKGSKNHPAMSRPGITEIGQAAISLMNLTSSANYNGWVAGASVDYLAGIDDEGMDLVREMERAGSRRIPLAPHGETDTVPTVTASSAGAVQAEIFEKRERSIWSAATRLGMIEAGSPVASSSGASQEAGFKGTQMPRVVWAAQNLAECQNNIIRYIELRYGIKNPSGQAIWPLKFDMMEIVDRIRKYFEIERLAGIRSKTVDARAMVQAAEEAGFLSSPEDRANFLEEFKKSADTRDKMEQQAAVAGALKPMQSGPSAKRQADREALKKGTRTRGKPGRPGPNQKPVNKSAPGVKR